MAALTRPPGSRVRRRRRSSRPLVLMVLLTLLVLAVSSVARTSGDGPDPRQAYLDGVRPEVDLSTRQGAALEDLRRSAGTLGANGLRGTLERLRRQAEATIAEVEEMDVPDGFASAHGMLLASLTARRHAVVTISEALAGALSPGGADRAAVEALIAVGRDIAVSDRAYELFLDGLPDGLRETMPSSEWAPPDDHAWTRPDVLSFVAALRASASLAPVHDVAVVTVSVDPPPVRREGDASVVVAAGTVDIVVVVANVGNEREERVPVQAVATSVGGLDVARQFVDLDPGQRLTVPLTIRPAPGGPATVEVRVGPVAQESEVADNSLDPPLKLLLARATEAP